MPRHLKMRQFQMKSSAVLAVDTVQIASVKVQSTVEHVHTQVMLIGANRPRVLQMTRWKATNLPRALRTTRWKALEYPRRLSQPWRMRGSRRPSCSLRRRRLGSWLKRTLS